MFFTFFLYFRETLVFGPLHTTQSLQGDALAMGESPSPKNVDGTFSPGRDTVDWQNPAPLESGVLGISTESDPST